MLDYNTNSTSFFVETIAQHLVKICKDTLTPIPTADVKSILDAIKKFLEYNSQTVSNQTVEAILNLVQTSLKDTHIVHYSLNLDDVWEIDTI